MEARLIALEGDVREIKIILGRLEPLLGRMDDRLRGVELGVAELKGRVSELPTTMLVFTHMLGLLGGVVAIMGLTLAVGRFLIEH